MVNYVALAIFATVLTAGQVFFKLAAGAFSGRPAIEGLLRLATTPTFYFAVTLYGAATLLWVWILSRMPLSQAYPWVAIATVAVPVLGAILFGEGLKPLYWLGIGFVVLGVFLTQQAAPAAGR